MEELTIVEAVVEDNDRMFSEVVQVRHRMLLRKFEGIEVGQSNGTLITQEIVMFLKNLMQNDRIEMSIMTSILQGYFIPVDSNG